MTFLTCWCDDSGHKHLTVRVSGSWRVGDDSNNTPFRCGEYYNEKYHRHNIYVLIHSILSVFESMVTNADLKEEMYILDAIREFITHDEVHRHTESSQLLTLIEQFVWPYLVKLHLIDMNFHPHGTSSRKARQSV
jgi:hypothetical protein